MRQPTAATRAPRAWAYSTASRSAAIDSSLAASLRTSLRSARDTTSNDDSLPMSARLLGFAVLDDVVRRSDPRQRRLRLAFHDQLHHGRAAQPHPEHLVLELLGVALGESAGEEHRPGGAVLAHLHPAVAIRSVDLEHVLELRRRRLQGGRGQARLWCGAAADPERTRRRLRRLLLAAAPKHPDHAQDEQAQDRHEHERVAAAVAVRLADDRRAAERLVLRVRWAAARTVLAEDDVRVEAEIGRIRAQKALDVRGAGHDIEVLVLHGLDVLDTDLRVLFDLLEREVAAHPRLAQRVADLKHGG